jgi:hypothetical protein
VVVFDAFEQLDAFVEVVFVDEDLNLARGFCAHTAGETADGLGLDARPVERGDDHGGFGFVVRGGEHDGVNRFFRHRESPNTLVISTR